MRILFEPSTHELEIEASGTDLDDLAAFLKSEAGAVYENGTVARRADEPYSKCLSRIVLDHVEDQSVRLSVQADECLVITGDARKLSFLTTSIVHAARMPAGERLHMEFYPGHRWLTEDSYPLVVYKTGK